jgi:mono/diheme cytochrome c family protein
MKNLTPILVAAVALSLSSVRAADVKELYEKNCTKCHGADGKGDTKMGKKVNVKDLTDAKYQAEWTDAQAFKTIKDGKKDKEDKVLMKPLEGATDDDVKALVAYSRAFKK